VSCLSQYPNLLKKIIPPGQGFTSAEDYCGIFRFNFWAFGKWREIIVDDKLPTFNGRLVFMHSPENNEFWTALLEKAYAKYELRSTATTIGNESAPIQLTQYPFPGQAISSAKILIYFSNKIYGSSFIKQHSETVTV